MFVAKLCAAAALICPVSLSLAADVAPGTPHNLILFVPDGLRAAIVNAGTAPALTRLRDEGVNFVNSHSMFPTFTTANASAFATGHSLGDTGDFSNTIFSGFGVKAQNGSVTPFLESNPVLAEMSKHYAGNYLNEESIIAAARNRQMSTAIIGKLGPVGIFDLEMLTPGGQNTTLIVDDTTGHGGEVVMPVVWRAAFEAAGVKAEAPGRGDNGNSGDNRTPGTLLPNWAQQQYFLEVALKVVLPAFKAANKPFVLVYWSRDPDGTQHNQGDRIPGGRLGSLTPGINGPTSMSAIRAVDGALAAIEQALLRLDLAGTTNIVVAADHGFSTISKASATSPAAKQHYADVNANELPSGFLAIDLAEALAKSDPAIRLFDPDANDAVVDWKAGQHPSKGNGLIGKDAAAPRVVVAANGGSDLIYIPASIPKREATKLGAQLVRTLLDHDYVSGLFVDRARFGDLSGTLALSDIGLAGSAATPFPAVVVNFTSFGTGCDVAVLCAAEVSDTKLQQGQGMHGSFSRADTWNFMAARGPDFRKGLVSNSPASNADIGMTMAHLLQLNVRAHGKLLGRVLHEALAGDDSVSAAVTSRTLESRPAANGLKTILKTQSVGTATYFDAAGFPGRTIGLAP